MNKVEFLRDLNSRLEPLEVEERREILEFYEERFYSGVFYESKTEEEIVNELESPGVIAKNVLHEYGISPKYAKTNDIRYKNIRVLEVILIISFDLIIASWLIPTLFSVTFSLFASLVTFLASFTLLIGDYGTSGPMLFAFSTSIYIFILLFALFMLDLSIAVTKSIVSWHLNVFKVSNRSNINKKLNKTSIDGWFKKHRKANLLKRTLFLLALVLIIMSGYQLTVGDNSFIKEYQNRVLESEVFTTTVSQDLIDGEKWSIVSNTDILDVSVIVVESETIKVTHNFYEDIDFEVSFDEDENTIIIDNVDDFSFFTFDIINLFFNDDSGVVVELPSSLLLDEVSINGVNGEVVVSGIDVDSLNARTTNGNISIINSKINQSIDTYTTNGDIKLKDLLGKIALESGTFNGNIKVDNVEFTVIETHTTNGNINLDNLGLDLDGITLIAQTKNGNVDIDNAYFNEIVIITTNGNIDFNNDDDTYIPGSLTIETTNGIIDTDVR